MSLQTGASGADRRSPRRYHTFPCYPGSRRVRPLVTGNLRSTYVGGSTHGSGRTGKYILVSLETSTGYPVTRGPPLPYCRSLL